MIPMKPGQKGSAPFTETLADMERRDQKIEQEIAQGLRSRPPLRSVFNIFEEKLEEEMYERFNRQTIPGVTPFNSRGRIIAPPFRGNIDSTGHFLPVANDLQLLPVASLACGVDATVPQAQREGIAFDGPNKTVAGFIPPDTQGAVGGAHVMMVVNGRVTIHRKFDGGTLLASVSLDSFFEMTIDGKTYPRNGAFDPRLLYDRASGRWFATGMEFGSPFGEHNGIILAVSRTGVPTGTWDKYYIDMGVPGAYPNSFLTDYSTLGVDNEGVYMAARIFPREAGTERAKFAVTAKASLLADPPALSTVFFTDDVTDMYSTPQPAHNLDNSAGGRAWFISSFNTTAIALRSLTWSAGVPSLSATTFLGTPTAVNPINAPALGSTTPINTGDFRSQMAMIRRNRLWTTRAVGMLASGVSNVTDPMDRAGCEWMEIDVSTDTPAIVQTGRVFDSAALKPRFYFHPSLAISGQGHVAMGFSGVKDTESVGIFVCGRLATDAPGTMQAILQTKVGSGSYTLKDFGGRNRWGDYSYTCVDPDDDQTLWTFQEYCSADNIWSVRAQRLWAPEPTATAATVSALPGQLSVSLPITGTGLFDPGPGFTRRLEAAVSGTGVTVNNVSYLGPTRASVTFSVAASAASGLRDVTITNPDGQFVTIPGAILIKASAPAISVTRTIVNTGSAWRVTFTLTNTGGSNATSIRIRTSLLGTTATTTVLPLAVSTMIPGATATVILFYPLSAATAGVRTVSRITGDFTGGTFSSAVSITP